MENSEDRAQPYEQLIKHLGATSQAEELFEGRISGSDLTRMKRFLEDRYAGATPVLTKVSAGGQIFDYFRADDQPATRAHGLRAASPPPDGFLGVGRVGLQFRASDDDTAGLVPIRRLTLRDLSRFGSLDRFLHKRGARHRSRLRAPEPLAPGSIDASHQWAAAYQTVANNGAFATLNVWQPQLAVGQMFSLSQIWCVALGPHGRQTAEVGWHVNPGITGHDQPAMFCYWTADGYNQTGSYNGAHADFHYNGANTVLGVAIDDVSVTDGSQHEVFCAVTMHEGNWWIYVGGDQAGNAVGYFPGLLYGSGPLASGATEVDFGGEVCGGPPYAPMGSGAFASAGYARAAYQRNVGYYDPSASPTTDPTLSLDQAAPQDFTIGLDTPTAPFGDWGEYIYFGGPGG